MAEGGKDILTSNHLDAPSTSSGSALSKKGDNKDFFSQGLPKTVNVIWPQLRFMV